MQGVKNGCMRFQILGVLRRGGLRRASFASPDDAGSGGFLKPSGEHLLPNIIVVLVNGWH